MLTYTLWLVNFQPCLVKVLQAKKISELSKASLVFLKMCDQGLMNSLTDAEHSQKVKRLINSFHNATTTDKKKTGITYIKSIDQIQS